MNGEVFEVLFLGTGAADWPLVKDSKRKEIDYSFRRWSSALIDKNLLLDASMSFLDACKVFHVEKAKIKNILITHSHDDHYCKEVIEEIAKEQDSGAILHLYGPEGMRAIIPQCEGIKFHGLIPGDQIHLEEVTVTAVEANHEVVETGEICLHYILSKDKKTLFYGCDGAWILQRTWNVLCRFHFDAMIVDATIGVLGSNGICGHNNLAMVKLLRLAFLAQGLIDEETKVIASHIGLTLYPAHEDIVKMMDQNGLMTAYDGMIVKI